MSKPCNTCPFLRDTKNIGTREWLIDVFRILFHGSLRHTCHKTDRNADGYVGGSSKMCVGIKLVSENDRTGTYSNKNVFKTWPDFFKHHSKGQKFYEGGNE